MAVGHWGPWHSPKEKRRVRPERNMHVGPYIFRYGWLVACFFTFGGYLCWGLGAGVWLIHGVPFKGGSLFWPLGRVSAASNGSQTSDGDATSHFIQLTVLKTEFSRYSHILSKIIRPGAKLSPGGRNNTENIGLNKNPSLWPGSLRGVRILKTKYIFAIKNPSLWPSSLRGRGVQNFKIKYVVF